MMRKGSMSVCLTPSIISQRIIRIALSQIVPDILDLLQNVSSTLDFIIGLTNHIPSNFNPEMCLLIRDVVDLHFYHFVGIVGASSVV